ncbi:hypothetical protein [Natrinema versiforme]|uniref:Potassium transporter TrkA n=1 Tax=Natrinema versiforme TaxID=88724 RepID=A0A4P8WF75_9EURY|nr:hypothetical protein [Natrinema versiforme]QCS41967.1 hypothetical protein FEJ81_06200 [Natrinema versiforme]
MIGTTTELITGLAFGLVFGIGPAIIVGLLGAAFHHRGSTLPWPGTVAIALSLTGLNAAVAGVLETSARSSARLAIGAAAVCLLAVYAVSQGERAATELPIGIERPVLRRRALSAEAIDSIDATGQVTIRTTGAVRSLDGYPSLSPDLRATLEADSWRLPADLPLSAIETRLETRLRTEYALAAVSVSIDGRGRATVAAAPPSGGDSTAVPDGWRAVSIDALLPTGLAPGDDVAVHVPDEAVRGTVLSSDRRGPTGPGGRTETEPGVERGTRLDARGRPTAETAGGDGRVTVAVPSAGADALLAAERARIVVPAGGTDADREAISRLERADYSIRRASFGAIETALESVDDVTDDELHILAATRRTEIEIDTEETAATSAETIADRETWAVDPEEEDLEDGDDVFVAGERTTVKRALDAARDSKSGPNTTVETEVRP